jgi:hypothetical protein
MLKPMDERLFAAPVVVPFAAAVRDLARVTAFYAGGSIGSATTTLRSALLGMELLAARRRSPQGADVGGVSGQFPMCRVAMGGHS